MNTQNYLLSFEALFPPKQNALEHSTQRATHIIDVYTRHMHTTKRHHTIIVAIITIVINKVIMY